MKEWGLGSWVEPTRASWTVWALLWAKPLAGWGMGKKLPHLSASTSALSPRAPQVESHGSTEPLIHPIYPYSDLQPFSHLPKEAK